MEAKAKRKGPFELSTDTRILYNVLEKSIIKEGKESVSYKELTASIGRDVQSEARGLLATARKHIQREHKILLETVMGEGVRKSEDYKGAISKIKLHVHRTVRHRTREVANAVADKEIDSELSADLSIMGVLELFARPKIPEKLLAAVSQKKLRELPTDETLKLFQGTIKTKTSE